MNKRKRKPQTFVRFRGTRPMYLERYEGHVRITMYHEFSQGELQQCLKQGWEVYRKWTNN